MPALPLINNVVKGQLFWTDDADTDVTTTLYFRYTGGPPNATACAALATDLVDAFIPLNGLWHNDTVLTGAKIQDLSDNEGGVGEVTVAELGSIEAAPLAGGSALVSGYLINRRYRGGKPRSYWPWGASSTLARRQAWSGEFIGSCLSGLETAFSTFIGSASGGTTIASHANVSYYSGFTVITNPSTGRSRNVPKLRLDPLVDDVVGYTILGRPGSQRRRNAS